MTSIELRARCFQRPLGIRATACAASSASRGDPARRLPRLGQFGRRLLELLHRVPPSPVRPSFRRAAAFFSVASACSAARCASRSAAFGLLHGRFALRLPAPCALCLLASRRLSLPRALAGARRLVLRWKRQNRAALRSRVLPPPTLGTSAASDSNPGGSTSSVSCPPRGRVRDVRQRRQRLERRRDAAHRVGSWADATRP